MDAPTQVKVTLADGTELTGEVVKETAAGRLVNVPYGSAYLNSLDGPTDVTFEDLPPPEALPLDGEPEPETPAKRTRKAKGEPEGGAAVMPSDD